MRRRAWILVTVGLSLALVGCRNDGAGVSGCPSAAASAPPVDAALLAFLSAARSLHHEADLHEADGDLAGAIAALERLVTLRGPSAVEVDEVLADARARLAELRLRRGDLAGAARDVEDGLRHVSGPTYFRGHLLEVQGLIEEARAATLADAGHKDEAAKARARAIALLEEAVRVQEQVIGTALSDGGHDG